MNLMDDVTRQAERLLIELEQHIEGNPKGGKRNEQGEKTEERFPCPKCGESSGKLHKHYHRCYSVICEECDYTNGTAYTAFTEGAAAVADWLEDKANHDYEKGLREQQEFIEKKISSMVDR